MYIQDMMNSIKLWLDRNMYVFKAEEPEDIAHERHLSNVIFKASEEIRGEEIDLLRGNISRSYYELRYAEITEKHYKNLRLINRLTISLSKFKTLIKNNHY